MKFGLCATIEQSAEAKAGGFEFVEETVSRLLLRDDRQPDGGELALPVWAANQFLPDTLKLAGPDVDVGALRAYVQSVCVYAGRAGARVLVFDAAGARTVPEGFDRKQARRQILEFLRMALPFCARHGIMLVCQPLRGELCNVINTLPEAMTYVWEVDHPNFQCLLDIGHFVESREPLENLRDALLWIRHVHIPIASETVEGGYVPLFAELKHGGYDGLITAVPASDFSWPRAASLLEMLKERWASA